MGVPGLVAWLWHNHKRTNFIFKQLFKSQLDQYNCDSNNRLNADNILDLEHEYFENDVRVDTVEHLLIDTNCLIHPQAKEVCIANPNLVESNLDLLEKKIINKIITYIELLISNTNPLISIYIAIDGVAPMAKIKHQRLRRFKSVYDRKKMERIANKHKKFLPKEWNTSAITPGTIFMNKLTKAIMNWANDYAKNYSTKHPTIIFSSSYVPGEGEHKLLQYLKTLNLSTSDSTVIYGLDADLLFLSLTTGKKNLYLMRETSEMELNKQQKYNIINQNESEEMDLFSYLSIDILRQIIKQEMLQRLGSDRLWDENNLINDFVFLCYFCGNDFLPNLPSLSIKTIHRKIPNGIDTILNTYTDSIINLNNDPNMITEYLISHNNPNLSDKSDITYNKIKINRKIFIDILDSLANQELEYFNMMYKYKKHYNTTDLSDPYKIDIFNYNENIIEKYYDPIKLGSDKLTLDQMKISYYKHYYNITIDPTNKNDKSLYSVLDSYVKGLIWTLYYYYDKCKDYEWFFEHHHGPFVSDLANFVKL